MTLMKEKIMVSKIVLIFTILFGVGQISAVPHIDSIKWGAIQVSDDNKEIQVYHNVKIWPTKSCKWNWKETGTQHVPGIQIADVREFIDMVDIVILTRGMSLALQVPQATIDYVKKQGKQCYVGQTEEMIILYNQLSAAGKKVGGLFHSTC